MFFASTDRAWEQFGRDDPYFGVLVESKYKAASITQEARRDFFRSGTEHVERIMQRLRQHLGHPCRFQRALDFGCGVGRLTIPLAQYADAVVGMDVSDAMLSEARNNCRRYSQQNITFEKSDDELNLLTEKFDFVHSYIVLQHIPVKRGYRIISNLLSQLEVGGVGVLHVTYAKDCLQRIWLSRVRKYVPLFNNAVNLLRGRNFFAPLMQMNDYDLKRVFRIMQTHRVGDFHAEYTDHGGHLGLVLYFKKLTG
jgi:SAM-dependent methyltransferase